MHGLLDKSSLFDLWIHPLSAKKDLRNLKPCAITDRDNENEHVSESNYDDDTLDGFIDDGNQSENPEIGIWDSNDFQDILN